MSEEISQSLSIICHF